MKDIGQLSDDKKDRIISWLFLLTLRLYGQNIYSDKSYMWKILELDTIEEIDKYFEMLLGDFKNSHSDISKLYKRLFKQEDILSR